MLVCVARVLALSSRLQPIVLVLVLLTSVGFAAGTRTRVYTVGDNSAGQLGDGNVNWSPKRALLAEVNSVSGGSDHTVALRADGTVWAWGNGPLGDGTTNPSIFPVAVPGLTDVIQVAAGTDCTLALRSDGSVWAWGVNADGRLGDGTLTTRPAPVQLPGLSNSVQVAARSFSAALRVDGTVWHWGPGGRGSPIPSGTLPVQAPGLLNITAVSVGSTHLLAIDTEKTVWAWGVNSAGQLGDGTKQYRAAPVQVAGLDNVVAVAAGAQTSLALQATGEVWQWGGGVLVPTRVQGLPPAARISASNTHALTASPDGELWAWGSNTHGQLGDGTLTAAAVPVRVGHLPPSRTEACGSGWSMAVSEDGVLYGWGANRDGQLGTGEVSYRARPVEVSDLVDVVEVAAGSTHILARRSDGTVWAWGAGALGNGIIESQATPVQVAGLTDVTRIAAGLSFDMALKADGSVWCWGTNNLGQLGDGTHVDRLQPVKVGGLANATEIAAGHYHGLAVVSAGYVYAWGWNYYGQLGNETTIDSPVVQPVMHPGNPLPMGYLDGVVSVAAGDSHSLAIKGDGTIMAWGSNYFAELGNGTSGNYYTSAVPVASLGPGAVLAARGHASLAADANGSVWGWGRNTAGCLGLPGSGWLYWTPTQVPGPFSIARVATSDTHSLAAGSGEPWSVGAGTLGQLGDGTTLTRMDHARVVGLHAIDVAAGPGYSVFVGWPLTLADLDSDGDVDLEDMVTFLGCGSGPLIAVEPGCEASDFDADGDVDQSDFGMLQRCLSGADEPTELGCAE